MQYGVTDAKASLVSNSDYLTTLRSIIQSCSYRLWSSIFILDLSPRRDRDLMVDSVLTEIRNAIWRGVDARILIGGSRTNFNIARLSDAARTRALELGIPCRLLTSTNIRGSHTKMVIADKWVLTGSHNWSGGAFTDQTQDSLIIESDALSAYLSKLFEEQWNRAEIFDV